MTTSHRYQPGDLYWDATDPDQDFVFFVFAVVGTLPNQLLHLIRVAVRGYGNRPLISDIDMYRDGLYMELSVHRT